MENNIEYSSPEGHDVDIREQLTKYLKHWPWFVLSLIIAFGIASLYLLYASPVYNTNATILIKDDGNRAVSELAAFQDLGVTAGLNPSGFENEIQILKSNSLTERVVRNLNLNISYVAEGNIRDDELFEDSPILVRTVSPDSLLTFSFEPFYVLPISETKFKLWDEDNVENKEYNYGDIISLPAGDIQITANNKHVYSNDNVYNTPITVNINTIPSTVAKYRNSLEIEQLMKMSSVIQLTLNASNRKKSEAILNEFIEQYNEDAINDRSMVTRNTAEFIQGRLEIISEELDSVEVGKVDFKQSHKLTDLQAEGQITLAKESEFMKGLLDVEIQLELIKITTDYVKNAGDHDLLPVNLGIEKDGVAHSIDAYNEVVLQRSRLLAGSTEKNPSVILLNNQIQELRTNILEGLYSAKTSLEIRKNDFIEQSSKIDSKISSAPSKEKIFRSISRQQELKETLYLYLLQKREENAISMAVTTPKAKVVDYAYSSLLPISPKSGLVRILSVILGLIIPFIIIYLRILLDNKIRNKFQMEQENIAAPVIGEIPKLSKKDDELVKTNDRSITAESFRILSTNLEYLFVKKAEKKEKGRVVLVTSTIKGEGKTFISTNLSLTLANSGARVILVGGDLRNPQIHRYSPGGGNRHKNGVVEYLINPEREIDEFIESSDINDNLSLMFSGTIPPNPAELWMLKRTDNLFRELRERFDYVIVDTAPSMLVTDTFLLRDYADSTIYVTRAGFTQRSLLGFANESIKFKKLTNVAFVINNVSAEDLGYGSKYGYYYSYGYGYGSQTKRTLWNRIKSSF